MLGVDELQDPLASGEIDTVAARDHRERFVDSHQ
jgi:hypothetical protein